MGEIVKAGCWSNGEVAYLAWEADAPIAGCIGFMVGRVHETGDDAGTTRLLPTWIAFTDQSNPQWLEQDSSVWPIQQYQWRDLTLRKSRNTTKVRPIDFRVHYEITPVGFAGPGDQALPASPTAPYRDEHGQPRYEGPQHPLKKVGKTFVTDPIDVTHDYGPIRATYTNGILSTQNLLQQLESVQGTKPANIAAGPATGVTKGLLATLKKHICIPQDPIREFLTGDALSFLLDLIGRAEKKADGELYCALYELHDPELIDRLVKLAEQGKAHVILSSAGSYDPTPKAKQGQPKPPKQPMIWDTENHDARALLHAAAPDKVQDRLFNNQSHIGHNKLAVYVEGGKPKAILSGSTNWTETGLCTQSNNALIVEDPKIAAIYLAYWQSLWNDPQPAGAPYAVGDQKGFKPNSGVQGPALRASNASPPPAVTLKDGKTTVEAFFSPNTKATTKNNSSPTPVDLSRVYSLMEHAEHALLFLAFLPGVRGSQNVIGTAAKLAEDRSDLLVQGAISDPSALPPPPVAGEPTTYKDPADGKEKKLPLPAIWWPNGETSRIAMVRAAAITVQNGNMRPELLSAGHAIIHDKIIVIDPLDPEKCAVITGSHNQGYKASYQNDENLLVIRGNQALAISYAIHVLDVYDHYVMRAKLQDELRKALIATGKPPVSQPAGFLRKDAGWQNRWFATGQPPSSQAYFLGNG